MVMIQPKLADDNEADQPAQELRPEIDKSLAEFARATVIVQNRHFHLEHQQRYDNREDAVAEPFNPVKTQLALPKSVLVNASTQIANNNVRIPFVKTMFIYS